MLPEHIELLSLDDIDCHDPIPETAQTIAGNAMLKADFVRIHYQLDCFADDTGLEVTALNNEPGVYSARYAGPENDAAANISKLLSNLEGSKDRSARFKTAIALTLKGQEVLFEGICEGTITASPRGADGFGYDPLFIAAGGSQHAAELRPEDKNRVSHRAIAVTRLLDQLGE